MGNQQTQPPHPASYYSVEYLNGSTGTILPDILNREYSSSPSDSMVEETHETSSSIIQPVQSKIYGKMCTIQRSKSYVRPENKVLPGDMPTKPLRKTNYLQTEGHKRTWRQKNGKKNGANNIKNFNPNCSMPEIYNVPSGKTNVNRSESESSSDWKRPSSIAALRDQRHIMQNEIKNFRDKYSRSMENLEEWTADDKLQEETSNKKKNSFYRKIFNTQEKVNYNKQQQVIVETEKKVKGFKIDPVKVEPLKCTQKAVLKKPHLRPPHLTSTPTNLDRDNELSFVISESKHSDINSGILAKKNKSKDVRKSVDFCFEEELEKDKDFVPANSNGAVKKNSNLKPKDDDKKINLSSKSSQSLNNKNIKLDTIGKAKAILLQSKRRQLMEQSINESLDLQDGVNSEKSTIKKGKLKSKSFLINEGNKDKNDSIKIKFGIRSIRHKNEDRTKVIDLEKDIQIISRFPINSKVYRHYIGGGSACDKLTNSYNTAKMIKNEDKLLSQSFVSLDSSDLNERGIDVNSDDQAKKAHETKKPVNEPVKQAIIESINQVFDPIYDSIDDYQSKKSQQVIGKPIAVVKFEKPKLFNDSNLYENDCNFKEPRNNPSFVEYNSGFLKSTSSFKPIAKVNPTTASMNSSNESSMPFNSGHLNQNNKNKYQQPNRSILQVTPSVLLRTNDNCSSNFQTIVSKFDSQSNNGHTNGHYTEQQDKCFNNDFNSSKNDALRINSHVNRKCSMSSEKLDPIFEGTPNKNISEINNNRIRRKSTIGKLTYFS